MRDTKSEVIKFWFEETQPQQWFQKNADFDAEITDRFMGAYKMARDGFFDEWMKDAKGCLALCIILDQFPRNMFRGSAESYATDEKARKIAKHALDSKFDQLLSVMERHFLYMPYMHSEDLEDQEKSVKLFEAIKDENPVAYKYALTHRDDIVTYGRFPYRNEVLGRENTEAEKAYLTDK